VVSVALHCVAKNAPTLKRYSSKIVINNFEEIWQIYSKDSRIEFACFSFYVDLLFSSTFRLSDRTPRITRILTLYQANAETVMPFSKEGTILKKSE